MRFKAMAGRSVRTRMTMLYGGLFAVIALGVLTGAQWLQQRIVDARVGDAPFGIPMGTIPCGQRPPEAPCSKVPFDPSAGVTGTATDGPDELQRSLIGSQRMVTVAALVVIVVLAFAVCWWLTGRLLRPLHDVTATARRLSLTTMHERIGLAGPPDELKNLADTFDAMLDRLEHAVASQRRFVANASHELRTPLAIQRTALEIGLVDPTPERLEAIRTELLNNTLRSERLIEGLLVLAQGERGLDTRAPVPLQPVVEQVIEDHLLYAERDAVTLTTAVQPVTVAGDEVMLTRLAANLVQNAIRHNHPGGNVLVKLSPEAGLVVSNTGPPVPPDQVGGLFEPFRRLDDERTGSGEGAGLGLSIVAAIADAHGGRVRATANPAGGLTVTVTLPAPTPAKTL